MDGIAGATIPQLSPGLSGGFVHDPRTLRQDDFSAILSRATSTSPASDQTPEQAARSAAEQFVAITLVQPLLAQLRASNHAPPPFAPSRGEQQFQSMLDAGIARNVVRAAHFPLVDHVARQLLMKSEARP